MKLRSLLALGLSISIIGIYPAKATSNVLNSYSNNAIQQNLRYDSLAHLFVTNSIKLKFPDGEKNAAEVKFKLANGLETTYGEISYLMADFIGDPDSYVLKGGFKKNFDLLYEENQKEVKGRLVTQDIEEVRKVIGSIYKRNKEHIEHSEPLELNLEDEIAFNQATGGEEIAGLPSKLGVYMLLALNNFEHFGQEAIDSYKAIHNYALKTAARGQGDISQLNYAYMLNAYASHYLVDIFATGHIRVPRRQLHDACSPSLIGDYFAKEMHDKENYDGLEIYINHNDHWRGFGDDLMFTARNKVNKEHIIRDLQLSADEIFEAYKTGNMNIKPSKDFVLPNIKETSLESHNPKPLYMVKNDIVYKLNGDGEYSKLTCKVSVNQP